jgi:hypothetical protein
MKGGTGLYIVLAVVVILVGGFLFISYSGIDFGSLLNVQFNFPWGQGEENGDGENGDGTGDGQPAGHLCDVFSTNYPSELTVINVACTLGGGNWLCTANQVGCYNNPTMNETICTTVEALAAQAFCITIGGEWTCNSVELSCERW